MKLNKIFPLTPVSLPQFTPRKTASDKYEGITLGTPQGLTK